MQTNILAYDRMTALDAVGPYEALSRLPGNEVLFVGERAGPVRADTGYLTLIADASFDEAPPADIVLVPGGCAPPLTPGPIHEWLRAADATSTWTTSVCVGSLILGAAGLLAGRRSTSHWLTLDHLRRYGAEPTAERVVFDGKYATAAGVSSGIDLALALLAKIAGPETAMAVQLGIEYDPEPPFQAGSPAKAPEPIVAFLRDNRDMIVKL
jgi:transcriptional regulator GlxA family with amidase domain